MSRKSNGALRAARERAQQARQTELAERHLPRRERSTQRPDEYRPTARDQYVARAASRG